VNVAGLPDASVAGVAIAQYAYTAGLGLNARFGAGSTLGAEYDYSAQSIVEGAKTPFIVTGNGGYHNLHPVTVEAGHRDPDNGATLKYASNKTWGFLTLTIDKKTISGVSAEIDRNDALGSSDRFSYPADPVELEDPKSVPTL